MTPNQNVGPTALLYARVSTADQGESGLSLDAQERALKAKAGLEGWTVEIYREIGSGKSLNGRLLLGEILVRLDDPEDPAAILVATKLDRVSRSAIDFATLLERARANGWALVLLDLGLDTSTPMGTFIGQIMAAVAELERKMIAERTSTALRERYRKTPRSRVVDRPITSPEERERILAAYERVRDLRAEGKSTRAIAARLNEEGVLSVTGKCWHDNSVRRALAERGSQEEENE